MALVRDTLIKNINEFLHLSVRECCNQVVNSCVDGPCCKFLHPSSTAARLSYSWGFGASPNPWMLPTAGLLQSSVLQTALARGDGKTPMSQETVALASEKSPQVFMWGESCSSCSVLWRAQLKVFLWGWIQPQEGPGSGCCLPEQAFLCCKRGRAFSPHLDSFFSFLLFTYGFVQMKDKSPNPGAELDPLRSVWKLLAQILISSMFIMIR